MPIFGGSLGDAARQFKEHITTLLARTITQVPVIVFVPDGSPVAHVGFRQGGVPIAAQLGTNYGPIGLSILQRCGSVIEPDGRHRLQTIEYAYTLTVRDEDEPCIRWEYTRERQDPDARWARHHTQGPFLIGLADGGVIANEMHLPTGFVTLEEVIRFCIVDLGVNPLSNDWHERLDESYVKFKTDFALPDLTDDSPSF